MRVTVCELNTDIETFPAEWSRLVAHAQTERSDLVVLPEMPFYTWFAWSRHFDPTVWAAAVEAHENWLAQLSELSPAVVVGSRPVNLNGQRHNEGFVWDTFYDYRATHHKYYLPEDEGFWEATWYQRGVKRFETLDTEAARLGVLLCTELWFSEHARAYGKNNAHLIAVPRATGQHSLARWVLAGQAAAIVSGAFVLSSNHVNVGNSNVQLGGQGWIINPEGQVLAMTSSEHPIVTIEIDLHAAEAAKQTYPRYVQE